MEHLKCPHCNEEIKLVNSSLTLEDVIDVVLDFYGVDIESVVKQNRRAPFSEIRQMICYAARNYTTARLIDIARKLKRDHTSVIHNVTVFENLLSCDERLKGDFQNVELLLKLLPETKKTYKRKISAYA